MLRKNGRKQNALRELNIEGTPVACELSDLNSVKRAVSFVQYEGISLQELSPMPNYGIAKPSTKNGIELYFTNHIGHFYLSQNS